MASNSSHESLGEVVLTAEHALMDGDLDTAEDALTEALAELRKQKAGGAADD